MKTRLLILAVCAMTMAACSKKNETTVTTDTRIKDGDGNVYDTVRIGAQVWLTENLKTTSYRNGDDIDEVSDSVQWSSTYTPAFCTYKNDSTYINEYGELYNWFAVHESRELCPTGYHIPADSEWTALINYLGTNAGGKLKETGLMHWVSPNAGASDSSGFHALPGGDRYRTGEYNWDGKYGHWWAADTSLPGQARIIRLDYNGPNVYRTDRDKRDGYSVRCLKD